MEEKEKKSLGHQVLNTLNRTKARKATISNCYSIIIFLFKKLFGGEKPIDKINYVFLQFLIWITKAELLSGVQLLLKLTK